MNKKNILVIGTFDTKNDELKYLSQQIQKLGGNVTKMDVSVLGNPIVEVDISKDDIAKAILANENLGEIVVSPNRSILQLDKTGASVLLIEKQQIDRSASTTVSGLLQQFGGFSIATKGNKGTDPSYFNRGLARK